MGKNNFSYEKYVEKNDGCTFLCITIRDSYTVEVWKQRDMKLSKGGDEILFQSNGHFACVGGWYTTILPYGFIKSDCDDGHTYEMHVYNLKYKKSLEAATHLLYDVSRKLEKIKRDIDDRYNDLWCELFGREGLK